MSIHTFASRIHPFEQVQNIFFFFFFFPDLRRNTFPPSQHNSTGMGRPKRKGEEGAAKTYITRNRALKLLQLPLADFRRLCILKGVYPREPQSRKKVNKGSTPNSTFYYTKDIRFLLHEPVLRTFREQKTFAKKLARALGKEDYTKAKDLTGHRPRYSLDHIVKERHGYVYSMLTADIPRFKLRCRISMTPFLCCSSSPICPRFIKLTERSFGIASVFVLNFSTMSFVRRVYESAFCR
jgi:hypothetical protein